MEYLEILSSHALEGLIVGLVAVLVYMVKKHDQSTKLKYDLATMLSIEIDLINDRISGSRMNRPIAPASYDIIDVPRETYDGLVNSGNIANFDINLQRLCQKFYGYERRREYDKMEGKVVDLIQELERFQRKNYVLYRRIYDALRRFGGRL